MKGCSFHVQMSMRRAQAVGTLAKRCGKQPEELLATSVLQPLLIAPLETRSPVDRPYTRRNRFREGGELNNLRIKGVLAPAKAKKG